MGLIGLVGFFLGLKVFFGRICGSLQPAETIGADVLWLMGPGPSLSRAELQTP